MTKKAQSEKTCAKRFLSETSGKENPGNQLMQIHLIYDSEKRTKRHSKSCKTFTSETISDVEHVSWVGIGG